MQESRQNERTIISLSTQVIYSNVFLVLPWCYFKVLAGCSTSMESWLWFESQQGEVEQLYQLVEFAMCYLIYNVLACVICKM